MDFYQKTFIIKNKFINNFWWALIIISSLGIGIILKRINFYIDPTYDQTPLVLSSISTGLAAILALIFAIIILSIQITQKYTAIDVFFNRITVILMLIFSITIILPLLMLEIGYYFPKIMISLFIFCIFSLYPFLKSINLKLKYEVGIQNLNEKISENFDLNYDASTANKIKELYNLGQHALKDNQGEKIDIVIKSLDDYSILATEKKLKSTIEAIETGIIELMLSAIEKKNVTMTEDLLGILTFLIFPDEDRRVINKRQLMLKNVGIKIIENKLDNKLVNSVAIKLFCIFESENYLFETKENCINYLSELYCKSYENKYTCTPNYIMIQLWYSCAYIIYLNKKIIKSREIPKASNEIYNLRYYAKEQLFKIEKRIGNPEFERLFKEAESYEALPGYLEALKEFKLFYDTKKQQVEY